MSFSVHTNVGVSSALQHVQSISRESLEVQNRIATGLNVGNAGDNGMVWALAQGMRASVEGRGVAINSVDMAKGVVEVGLAAAEGISDLMVEMHSKLLAATDTSLDESSWRALMSEFIVLGNEVRNLSENASFNGQNLLAAGAASMNVLVSDNPSITMTVDAHDLSDGGGIFDAGLPGVLPYADDSVVLTQPDQAMVAAFETSMADVNSATASLGVSLKSLEVHKVLLSKQRDVTEAGIGNLVDADLGKEAARLQALSVREQLGTRALGVANQAPAMLLSLFR
jgi:flagellin